MGRLLIALALLGAPQMGPTVTSSIGSDATALDLELRDHWLLWRQRAQTEHVRRVACDNQLKEALAAPQPEPSSGANFGEIALGLGIGLLAGVAAGVFAAHH